MEIIKGSVFVLMRLKYFIIILLCFIFLSACENFTEENHKDVIVSGTSITNTNYRSMENEKLNWEVTDLCGKKRELSLSDGDIFKKDYVGQGSFNYATEYSQVAADNNYYYMRRMGETQYSIYKNRGDLVGTFYVDKGRNIDSCIKYGDTFYVRSSLYETIEVGTHQELKELLNLSSVDFVHQKTDEIYEYPENERFGYFFNGFLYVEDYRNKCIDEVDLTKKENKKIELEKQINYYYQPVQFIINNRIYAGGTKEGKDIVFYRYNIDMTKKEQFFSYSYIGNNDKWKFKSATIDADGKNFYICEEYYSDTGTKSYKVYMISPNSKKIRRVSNNYMNSCLWTEGYVFYTDLKNRLHVWNSNNQKDNLISEQSVEMYSAFANYLFYLDVQYKIHEYNTKTQKDSVITDIKAMNIACTKEGLYVQKYNEDLADSESNVTDDSSCALYFMDFNGENVLKIEDEKVQLE